MDLADNIPNTPIELGFFESRVKSEFPYMEDEHIIRTVNRAKAIYYSAKYPCEPYADENTRPIVNFADKEKVIMICVEILEKLGLNSATAYKENGVSANYEGAWVSSRVLDLINPVIGVIS